ncbi:MAG: beta-galactosidase [Kiritimatiellia bacterium]|jgi:hypothetical protein
MMRVALSAAVAACAQFASAADDSEWMRPEWRADLESARLSRDRLAEIVPKLAETGHDAYARMRLRLIDKFIGWVEDEDIPAKVEPHRMARQTRELAELGKFAVEDAERTLSGESPRFCVPRYVSGPVRPSQAQMLATREWPDGRRETNVPVFFSGFGHFGRVRRDLEELPDLGFSFVQFETNWRTCQPQENQWKKDYLFHLFTQTADRAWKSGVRIDFNLSPHYLPDWAKEKHPETKDCYGGFFGFCVHHPEIRNLISNYFSRVVGEVKDHPALNSFCLANEPQQQKVDDCPHVRAAFASWLKDRYETVSAMNAKWRSSHATFEAVPVPVHPDLPATPAALEFIRFNRAYFASFLEWMANVVHSVAPDVPVHVKIVTDELFYQKKPGVFWSIDLERISEIMDFHDGDPLNFHVADEKSPYANRWITNQASYDFMRSMADKPLMNTENHNIEDRCRGDVPPEHVYSALWQNAIHGQSMTAMWCYERMTDPKATNYGLILERPKCLEAACRCALDLNRLADKIAPIQNQKPSVLILYSLASQVMAKDFGSGFLKAYEAASFLGQPLGVVTEGKLAAYARASGGMRPFEEARVVVLPDVTHLSDDALAGLKKLEAEGANIVSFGRELTCDDFGNRRSGRAFPSLVSDLSNARAVADAMFEAMPSWGLKPCPRVSGVDSDRPVFGVESHGYEEDGRSYVSVVNHLREPVEVVMPGKGRELITGRALEKKTILPPMMPVFVELEK